MLKYWKCSRRSFKVLLKIDYGKFTKVQSQYFSYITYISYTYHIKFEIGKQQVFNHYHHHHHTNTKMRRLNQNKIFYDHFVFVCQLLKFPFSLSLLSIFHLILRSLNRKILGLYKNLMTFFSLSIIILWCSRLFLFISFFLVMRIYFQI